ncbi:hypothetical protein GOY07_02420 [Wolbachia endosymbiont of Litomosoides sigmodontis]|uniref:hypothetical protein n=1 Tax=Wolbachia endosymbiont of Litomosoides sigmodontis TaxID=80850 RepID=UPI00158B8D16|nr:hypothetical protein [Wolbachia endosymbiont of Litomosoides sigmodontis]QKX03047.1 hypothetical protein GOY07_02420 [Wolbachia endosymbiont of Litomosoides sigmodontis]
MAVHNLNFVKELVNAFNINNYGSRTNTNFVVEGDNIVVKFSCDQRSAEKCLSQMARDLVREYFSSENLARHVFDLGSLPFNFDGGKWTYSEKMTKLTVPIDSGAIFNLKMHFVEEFIGVVEAQMIREINKEFPHLDKKHIEGTLNENIKQAKMDASSHCVVCLSFDDPDIQEHFKQTLKAQMKEYGYNYLDFYHIDDNKMYFKDVENVDFVKSVTEVSKKKTAYNFNVQGVGKLKVKSECYKGAIGELIFRLTGIPICGYYRDNFIDKGRINNGDNFAFIPMTKEGSNLRYLTYMNADKINAKFSYSLLTDVRGQTEATKLGKFGNVYAFSDGQVALLIPLIVENSVLNKDGQLEINPDLPRQLYTPSPPRSPSLLSSPSHEPQQHSIFEISEEFLPQKEVKAQQSKNFPTDPAYIRESIKEILDGLLNIVKLSALIAPGSASSVIEHVSTKVVTDKRCAEDLSIVMRGSHDVDKVMISDKMVEKIAHSLNNLPNEEKKKWEPLLSLFLSPEGIEELCSILSSSEKRSGLSLRLGLSPEQSRRLELIGHSLQQQYEQPHSQVDLSKISHVEPQQSSRSRQTIDAAAVDMNENMKGACGEFVTYNDRRSPLPSPVYSTGLLSDNRHVSDMPGPNDKTHRGGRRCKERWSIQETPTKGKYTEDVQKSRKKQASKGWCGVM